MEPSQHYWHFNGVAEDRRCGQPVSKTEDDELTNKTMRLGKICGTIAATTAALTTYDHTIGTPVKSAISLQSPHGWMQLPSGYRYRDSYEAGILGSVAGAGVYLGIYLLAAIGAAWIRNRK